MAHIIEFNQGWEVIQKGVNKLKNLLQGLPEKEFIQEDYMNLYTIVYRMCMQIPPHDYSYHLYTKYREIFQDYLSSTVLPSLQTTPPSHYNDDCFLTQIVKAWTNHKIMIRCLSRFFHYLDRNFVVLRALPTLNEVGMIYFHQLVYNNVKDRITDGVIGQIGKERDGGGIDQGLVKNAVQMFVEMRMGQLDCYQNDFEVALLANTSDYYFRKASCWVVEDSLQEFMLKAEECLKREKVVVARYLHASSEEKLLGVVRNVFENKLVEKEQSGSNALLEETCGKVAKLHLNGGTCDDNMMT